MELYTLRDKVDEIDPILEKIDQKWLEFGAANSFLPELIKKKTLIKDNKLQGVIGIKDGEQVCAAWIELPQPYYGQLLVYSLDPADHMPLLSKLLSTYPLQDCVVELIQFIGNFEIRDTLCQLGLLEKERQRMIYKITDDIEPPTFSEKISFEELSEDTIPIVGDISHHAHAIRVNIEGYHDFASVENRSEMERILRSESMGPNVKNASLLMKIDTEPVAIIDVVEMKGWGYKRIAWIMDVSVKPKYQGLGYGRQIIKKAIYETKKAGLPAIGLGVTISNSNAKHLYESIGFESVEFFVEFIAH